MQNVRNGCVRYGPGFLGIILLLLLHTAASGDQYVNGLVFDDESYARVPLTAKRARRDYSSLPAAVSLKKYAPTPGDQGQYGTCVAWSAGYHARTIAESIRIDRTNPRASDDSTFSTWHLYALSHKIGGNQHPTTPQSLNVRDFPICAN